MNEGKGQRGIILLETAISLPIMMLLLTAAVAMLLLSLRNYFRVLADAELHQEMQIAFTRMVQDSTEGRYITPYQQNYPGIEIHKRWYALRDYNGSTDLWNLYWIAEVRERKKLIWGADRSAPMTGDYSLAGVEIHEIAGEEQAACPGLYVLRLTGRSVLTNHYYTLSTAVYLPMGEGEAKHGGG